MNFTREPIIETVITPREGMKLLLRSSKTAALEEYFVDAIEVVSFGRSLFFRSVERPKSFLVPVSDYEVIELKELRVPLKNAVPDRSIKIGGGREARPPREMPMEEREPLSEGSLERSERPSDRPMEQQRKRDRRRRGRRGGSRHDMGPPDSRDSSLPEDGVPMEAELGLPPEGREEETKSPSFISKLFPPPPTLIKETLSRYKPQEPNPDESGEIPPVVEKMPDEDLFDFPASPELEAEDKESED